MYNNEVKKEYIEDHALKSHKGALGKLFTVSEELESSYSKDVYDFTSSEMERLFKELSPKSVSQGRKYFNALDEYSDWSSCQGHRRSSISVFAGVESNWVDKFVIKASEIDTLCKDEGKARLDKIRKDIHSKIEMTVQTGYGPSLVVGIVESEDGKEYVHLKEFGYEDYHVLIEEWDSLLV